MNRTRQRDPGKIVGYVEDEISKVKTEVRLLTDRMVFWARVGEFTTENKDGDVVRKWIRDQQKAMRATEWTAVIIVEYSSTDKPGQPYLNGREIEASRTGNIDFTARRSYLARIGKALRELDWKQHKQFLDPMARVDESYSIVYPADILDKLPWKQKKERWSSIEIVLPYDEQTWGGLSTIIASIERSRVALKKILGDAGEADAFLRMVGSGTFPVASLLPGQTTESVEDVEDVEDDDSEDDPE